MCCLNTQIQSLACYTSAFASCHYCPTVTTKHTATILFVLFFYQGEPGIDGEAGTSGPDGAKAS